MKLILSISEQSNIGKCKFPHMFSAETTLSCGANLTLFSFSLKYNLAVKMYFKRHFQQQIASDDQLFSHNHVNHINFH